MVRALQSLNRVVEAVEMKSIFDFREQFVCFALLGLGCWIMTLCGLGADSPAPKATPQASFTIANWTQPATYFQFQDNGKMIVKILASGKVELGDHITPDEASRHFWLTLTTNFPSLKQGISESYLGVTKAELLESLTEIEKLVAPKTIYSSMTLEYREPIPESKRLRQEADAIEAKEAAVAKFQAVLKKLRALDNH
jgi:hypothetical protein